MNIINELNPSQREAVEYCDGAALVIAGAGSGKTRVLTYKIAYLLQEKGLAPWNILALTFTNKAAREMKERIAQLVGTERARYLQMGTFHSIFARILRTEAQHIGYDPNFTIYDQADARSLVKSIIKEMKLDDKIYKPTTVSDQISMAKNHLVMPDQFVNCSLFDKHHPKVHEVYLQYAARCRQANAMDFDDLLVQTFLLFERNEDIRRKYVEKFMYVLVDEYQDTNFAQQKIVYQLTRERQRICVVGDDAQSIYSFRGANIDNILHFSKAYDNARLFKLEQNYRSTQRIVEAANSLIRKNEKQIPKNVFSENDEGEPVTLKTAASDKEEAMIVCRDIKRILKKENGQYSDFAILYRTNAQSRSFEEQMRKDDIPYRIYGGLSFYQRKEIKDAIAYFRLVANPNDEEALKRIINYPTRGIGDATLGKIVTAAAQNSTSLWDILTHLCPSVSPTLPLPPAPPAAAPAPFTAAPAPSAAAPVSFAATPVPPAVPPVSPAAAPVSPAVSPVPFAATAWQPSSLPSLSPATINKLRAFRQLVEGWMARAATDDAYELGHAIIKESGMAKDLYSGHAPEDLSRQENIEEFLSGIHDFVEGRREEDRGNEVLLSDFLQEVALLTDLDSDDDKEQPKVTLMTIHSAKGLEFPTVFVVGLEENIFPSQMCTATMRELEEERRLFYVAITRAERHCILTCAECRFRYGKIEYDSPSRFIRDIDPGLLRVDSSNSYDDEDFGTSNLPWKRKASASPRRPSPVSFAATAWQPSPVPSAAPPRQPSTVPSAATQESLSPVSSAATAWQPSPAVSTGLVPGVVIEHQRFGIGTVISMEGQGENTKATVKFRNAGTKQLLLKFAKYTIVS